MKYLILLLTLFTINSQAFEYGAPNQVLVTPAAGGRMIPGQVDLAQSAAVKNILGASHGAFGIDVSALSGIPFFNAGTPSFFSAPAAGIDTRNLIINGGFDFTQEINSVTINSASGISYYVADMWQTSSSGPTTKNYSQQMDSSLKPTISQSGNDSVYSLKTTILTGNAFPNAADYIDPMNYYMEGFDFQEISGQTVTFGFWVRASATGAYNFAIQGGTPNRSYVTTFPINVANTWEFKSITVTLDTVATWDIGDGLGAIFQLGQVCASGGTYETSTLNAWQTASKFCANTAVNWMANTNATFNVTQFSMVKGSIGVGPKGFTRKGKDIAEEKASVQRYYRQYDSSNGSFLCQFSDNSLQRGAYSISWPEMRVAPTVTGKASFSQYYHTAGNSFNGAFVAPDYNVLTPSTSGVFIYSNSVGFDPGNAFEPCRVTISSGYLSVSARF